MPLAVAFWVVFLIALVLMVAGHWWPAVGWPGGILLFILIGILGYHAFGPIIR